MAIEMATCGSALTEMGSFDSRIGRSECSPPPTDSRITSSLPYSRAKRAAFGPAPICGGLSQFDGRSFRTYGEKDGLLNSCVWALAEDAKHDLWIGTYGGGVFRFRDGHFTQYSKPQGLATK